MKAHYLLVFLLFCSGAMHAQVGIGTTTPNPNAVLELTSPQNNQGFLVPRLTTAQRTALSMSSAENGMLVYDSDENRFYCWQVSQWIPIRMGDDIPMVAGSGIDITGNTISAIPDGDGDPTNEIQDLQLVGNTLTITGNESPTEIDLAQYVGTNTDNQTLNYNGTSGVLGISGGNSVTITPAGAAGGALSGSYPNPGLADNAVTTSKINNGAVTSAKIADGTIATTDIADDAVTDDKLSHTGVTASTYGSETQVPRITVNAQGRITGVTLRTISGGGGGEDIATTLKNGNNANELGVTNLSFVTVGASTNPGALNVFGSQYIGVKAVDNGYKVDPSDYLMIYTNQAAKEPAVILLPPASENRGRILVFRSMATTPEGALVLRAPDDKIDGLSESEPLYVDVSGGNIAYCLTVLSVGNTWISINRAIFFNAQKR